MLKIYFVLLIYCGSSQVSSRSYGVRRDEICDDVESGVLMVQVDDKSCGTFFVCIKEVAKHFKCFNDKVFSNGTSVCLSCDEVNDEYYESEDQGYGKKQATKKKYTYKPTNRNKSTTKKYGKTTAKKSTSKSYPTNIDRTDRKSYSIPTPCKWSVYISLTILITYNFSKKCNWNNK